MFNAARIPMACWRGYKCGVRVFGALTEHGVMVFDADVLSCLLSLLQSTVCVWVMQRNWL